MNVRSRSALILYQLILKPARSPGRAWFGSGWWPRRRPGPGCVTVSVNFARTCAWQGIWAIADATFRLGASKFHRHARCHHWPDRSLRPVGALSRSVRHRSHLHLLRRVGRAPGRRGTDQPGGRRDRARGQPAPLAGRSRVAAPGRQCLHHPPLGRLPAGHGLLPALRQLCPGGRRRLDPQRAGAQRAR